MCSLATESDTDTTGDSDISITNDFCTVNDSDTDTADSEMFFITGIIRGVSTLESPEPLTSACNGLSSTSSQFGDC